MTAAAPPVTIRDYLDTDEPAVLELLTVALGEGPGGSRPPEFFRWKHIDNPFGRSFMLVAEVDGRIVGFRSFMRWRFRASGRSVEAVRAVDTATHPDYQGRGIFSQLTREALAALPGEVSFVFNTPNERSGPGYLKMGWRTVERVPMSIRLRRPLVVARARRDLSVPAVPLEPLGTTGTVPVADGLADEDVVARLIEDSAQSTARFATDVGVGYLRWRYAQAPLLSYVAVRDERAGRLQGLAILQLRMRGRLREATLAELFVREGDTAAARRLLSLVVRSVPAHYLAAHFPRGSASARAATRRMFVRRRGGMTLVVNVLGDVAPDPSDPASWALTMGDLEVF